MGYRIVYIWIIYGWDEMFTVYLSWYSLSALSRVANYDPSVINL